MVARQVRDKNCLAAIFALRHQDVSSGPLGAELHGSRDSRDPFGEKAPFGMTLSAAKSQRFAIAMPIADPRNR